MLGPETTILVLGGNGMLAHAVKRALSRRRLTCIAVDRADADLTDRTAVDALFDRIRPSVVFNCAAYTAVDKAEQEPELANAVNGEAVGNIAHAAKRIDAKLLHVSTDYVFDGTATEPYPVDHPTGPVSAYGRSKLLGEQALQKQNPPGWCIVRTAWLYGPNGPSFPKTMLSLARKGVALSVINDQRGTPTFTYDLAEALLNLVDADAAGVFHVTNAGETNWHDFAAATFEVFGVDADLSSTTAAEYAADKPAAAHRPGYSVLDLSAYEHATGKAMRPWRDALQDFREVTGGEP
ncbi:MAG: dTDP-4-dehydrorhamnose reductase [Planctomycetota bacterium]